MTQGKLLVIVSLLLLPTLAFPGTLFEIEKKASDPFVGDDGGFNSLLVNPAGIAGQSGFDLSVSVGAQSTGDDLASIIRLLEMADAKDSEYPDDKDGHDKDGHHRPGHRRPGHHANDLLVSIIDAASAFAADKRVLLESIFGDSESNKQGAAGDSRALSLLYGDDDILDVDLDDREEIDEFLHKLSDDDHENIEENIRSITDEDNQRFSSALPDDVWIRAQGNLKAGFLVKGFGLGVYDQAAAVGYVDSSELALGVESFYNEFGVITGFGFNLADKALSLGLSFNYSLLMESDSPILLHTLSDFSANGGINYNRIWGLDFGMIWRPVPSLNIGLVLNNVIGSRHVVDAPYYASIDYLANDSRLTTLLDMDTGITWQPDWKVGQPKFSLDFYNIISYGRNVINSRDDPTAVYEIFDHIRFGVNFTFFKVFKIASHYNKGYLGVGLGLDLLFFELYGEFKVHEYIFATQNLGEVPIAAELMARLHF